MVNYPDLSNVSNSSGIEGILTLPNASYPYFWTLIIFGIWAIFTFSLYFREKSFKGKGNLLSSAAVSSLVCIVLSTMGSLLGFVTLISQLPIFVFGILIIAIWIFSNK